ncbi:MAG: hypothetical protein ACRDFY_03265 [Candidatus Limnocylindria bacterium]
MEQPQGTCALCDDPIAPGEAWMTDEADDDRVAHSGCVYRDEEPDARDRWSPAVA